MLLLASLLQHLRPDAHTDIEGLSEIPQVMAERLAALAISYVTTKDELLGSIEGLDCIMIESVYQANLGNLRRSWLAARRAVSIAQLMGLNRSDNRTQFEVLDRRTKYKPGVMWSRIVFLDRFLSLMLGLPQGCSERDMTSEAMLTAELPMEQLERVHCAVASRILERHEVEPSAQSLMMTRKLDIELQKAARSIPSRWWLIPKLGATETDPQTLFWNTGRVFAQVLHYNLLNQLHLPYMLRSSTADRKYEYSRMTCVNASREVLSRFITLRSFNGIRSSCRIIDFLALMAAMTLLLAHLDRLPFEPDDPLGHQYHSDRAMIEQVEETFREVSSLNSDALCAKSADLFRRLLAMEGSRAHGSSQCAERVRVYKTENVSAQADMSTEGAVNVHIPYFGLIRITRDRLSALRNESRSTDTMASSTNPSHTASMFEPSSLRNSHSDFQSGPLGFNSPQGSSAAQIGDMVDKPSSHVEQPLMMSDVRTTAQAEPGASSVPTPSYSGANFPLQHLDNLAGLHVQHEEHPGLAAGMEDWAFQGVDMAFFHSLMSTTSYQEDGLVD